MWERDAKLFDDLCQKCGSRYLAVNYLANASRKLSCKIPGWVIESQLITWALCGDIPDIEKFKSRWIRRNPELRQLNEFLCYVDDTSVKESVSESYFASVRSHHLVYEYKEGLNIHQRARVRILLRMLWASYS